MKLKNILLTAAVVAVNIIIVLFNISGHSSETNNPPASISVSLDDIPEYSGEPYIAINNNIPFFTETDYKKSFEEYAPLDSLGRCGVAFANIGKDIMPTEARGDISRIKPSGWHSVRYDNVDGKSLYNRCHLIGFQLAGENANPCNLITGTRYLNVVGMLPFENKVTDYVKDTDNHVLYRVTPVFEGDNLVASGVLMEAYSVEDKGDAIKFNVYCYNVQPDIVINYENGESYYTGAEVSEAAKQKYILNTNSKKFHLDSCGSVNSIKEDARKDYKGSRDELISQGYVPCKSCNP